MAVTITAEQRDALYEDIVIRLTALDDILTAASKADYDTADQLARAFIDELRFVVDDLGWGPGTGDAVIELKTDPVVLRRVMSRIQALTVSEREVQTENWSEGRSLDEKNRLIGETCATVLEHLDGGQ